MGDDELILLGKVVATHGIRGQLRVVPYSGLFDTLLAVESVTLRDVRGKSTVFAVKAAAVHGKKLLLTLDGFSDINQALHLVGSELFILREQLPPPEEDEYYWQDLIGMTVVTFDGMSLGRLESIIETGSNDVYVVKSAGKEYLIPAIADVVVSVDVAAKVMTVSPIEGLFDL